MDNMEVFCKTVKQMHEKNPDFKGSETSSCVGLLMGFLCMLHSQEKGCCDAEFLAIDEDQQHKWLVGYSITSWLVLILSNMSVTISKIYQISRYGEAVACYYAEIFPPC